MPKNKIQKRIYNSAPPIAIITGAKINAPSQVFGLTSTGQANLLYDVENSRILLRGGGTTNIYIDTDGSLIFGDGVASISSNGISITAPTAYSAASAITITASGSRSVRLYGLVPSATTIAGYFDSNGGTVADATTYILATAATGFTGLVSLGAAVNGTNDTPFLDIHAGSAGNDNSVRIHMGAGGGTLQGLVIGANAAADAILDVRQGTLGSAIATLTSIATNDDPVETIYQNRVATTDATQTTLHTIAIAASKTYRIIAYVTARRTGGSGGTADDAAAYILVGTYKTVSGTVTLVGAVTTLYSAEDVAGYDATLDINSTNVRVRVTGVASTNITWHTTVSVSYVGT